MRRLAWAAERWSSARYAGPPAEMRRQKMIEAAGLDLVIDVGANDGGYGTEVRTYGYKGRLVSFEPVSAAYGRLRDRAADDRHWEVHKLALGASLGTFEINVAANQERSSSFLPQLDVAFGTTSTQRYVGLEMVTRTTLDTFEPTLLLEGSERVLLKLDVQGFELEVLRGAETFLERVVAIEVELSLRPLYAHQPSYGEVIAYLAGRGFSLWAVEPGYTDHDTGRLIEMDGIFVRGDGARGRA